MANASNLSLAELKALIAEQKSRLSDLKKQRTALEKELSGVNAEIATLEGKKRRRGRPAGSGTGKKRVRRRRSKNAKPLKDFITSVLTSNKKGLPLQGVHDKVLESGYKTTSKNFKNVLYQCLYHSKDFVHDDKAGVYKLKS